MLAAWCEYSYSYPVNKAQVYNQPLWLNSLIRVNDIPITNGLKVKQIINEDGKFKNYADIRRDMCDTSKIEYYTLCNSIPMPWRRILRMDYGEGQLRDNRLDNVLTCKNASQMVYSELVRNVCALLPRQK